MIVRALRTVLIGTTLLCDQSRAWHQDASNQRLPSIEEELRRHNIELTSASLVQALANGNAEVRWLAAEKLAVDRAVDAVPAIEAALEMEAVPGTRVNIAYALAQLGDNIGFSALKKSCIDGDDIGLRMRAARYLLDLHSNECLTAVLDTIRSADDQEKLMALGLLPRFQHVSGEEANALRKLLVVNLMAETPAVRIEASHALAGMSDRAAVPELRKAIVRERDDVVRSQMQSDVRALEQRH